MLFTWAGVEVLGFPAVGCFQVGEELTFWLLQNFIDEKYANGMRDQMYQFTSLRSNVVPGDLDEELSTAILKLRVQDASDQFMRDMLASRFGLSGLVDEVFANHGLPKVSSLWDDELDELFKTPSELQDMEKAKTLARQAELAEPEEHTVFGILRMLFGRR